MTPAISRYQISEINTLIKREKEIQSCLDWLEKEKEDLIYVGLGKIRGIYCYNPVSTHVKKDDLGYLLSRILIDIRIKLEQLGLKT